MCDKLIAIMQNGSRVLLEFAAGESEAGAQPFAKFCCVGNYRLPMVLTSVFGEELAPFEDCDIEESPVRSHPELPLDAQPHPAPFPSRPIEGDVS
jgi:hypothetical protein